MNPTSPLNQAHQTPKRDLTSSSSSQPPMSPAFEKLHKVKESLSILNTDIKDEVDHRKEQSENKLLELRETCAKLEKSLTLETRKRAESDKVLQTMMENKFQQLQDEIDKKFGEKLSQQQLTIDVMTKRIANLEKQLSDEKEKTMKLMQDLRMNGMNQYDELKTMLENERVARLEKEAMILKKTAEDLNRVHEKLEFEKSYREQSQNALLQEIQKLDNDRTKQEQIFKQYTMDELEILKQSLRMEQQAREAAEEQLVQTIDGIVAQLQESLRIVTKTH